MSIKIANIEVLDFDEAINYAQSLNFEDKDQHIELEDAILLLLSSIDYNKKIISRTLLMKEVFLLYEEIFRPLGLAKSAKDVGYIAYKFGPYSYQVNVSTISLVLAGKVQLVNYYNRKLKTSLNSKIDYQKDTKKGETFLAVYQTILKFEDITKKYKNLFSSKGVNIEDLRKTIADKKLRWDQRGSMGIIRYVYKTYKEYIVRSELKQAYPELFFGLVKEDRWLIYDRNRKY